MKNIDGRSASGKKWLLLVAFSAVLSLIVGEAALRLAWDNPFRGERPDRLLKLPLHHANTDHRINRSLIDAEVPWVRLRTDERSYILPVERFPEPDATIVFLGGSTTECEAVQEHLRFPALVSERLEDKGLRVNTLNAGRSGNTLHDSLNNLLNHIVLHRPDIAVVMHATNDVGVLAYRRGYAVKMGVEASTSDLGRIGLQMLSARSYLCGLLRAALTTAGQVRPANLDAREAERHARRRELDVGQYRARLELFVAMCRSFGIVPVLVTQPQGSKTNVLTPPWADRKYQEIFNDVIRETAARTQAPLIDLVRHLEQEVPGWDDPMNVFYDGGHVTDHGSEVYADYLSTLLEPVVLAARAERARAAEAAQEDPAAD